MATTSEFQPDYREQTSVGDPDSGPQSTKLETVGRMVSGVAHDFANLLTLIAGYADLLLERTGKHDPRHDDIREIHKAAERGTQLTSRLLGFLRREVVDPKPLDLNALVTDVERMLGPILGEHLEVVSSLSPDLQQVLADRGGMEQMLMNLLLNARDAMPGGGRIQIQTSNSVVKPEDGLALGIAAGPCVRLSVSDTGEGIGPQAAEQIFQPFFTTKRNGEGTGLGLSIVLRVVKESGGAIRVQSSPGKGATFHVYLPASGNATERRNPAIHPGKSGKSELVLLVEDEESVRRIMSLMLQHSGYRVIEAADGQEALEIFHARELEINLVLTDVVMPRMNGLELVGRIHSRRPSLPVICMSGYTDEVTKLTGTRNPAISFVEKPLRAGTLNALIREALDSASRPFNPS